MSWSEFGPQLIAAASERRRAIPPVRPVGTAGMNRFRFTAARFGTPAALRRNAWAVTSWVPSTGEDDPSGPQVKVQLVLSVSPAASAAAPVAPPAFQVMLWAADEVFPSITTRPFRLGSIGPAVCWVRETIAGPSPPVGLAISSDCVTQARAVPVAAALELVWFAPRQPGVTP